MITRGNVRAVNNDPKTGSRVAEIEDTEGGRHRIQVVAETPDEVVGRNVQVQPENSNESRLIIL